MTVAARPGAVVFEVTDRGAGFKPGEEGRVFERFYRSGGEGPPGVTHGSLGLGLSLVQRIATAHGGRAQAATRPTGGALVTLEFPSAPTAGAP